MSDTITLASVVARGVVITWPEAVAVVREVAERTVDASPATMPELQQVTLSPSGDVHFTGAVATREPVRRLGQLMLALLSKGNAPVQLRLVISQATAPQPAYTSVREFFDALAYFDRPEHHRLVRELYERAVAIPEVNSNASLDEIAPLPSVDPAAAVAEQRKKQKALARRARANTLATRLGATLLLLLLVGAAGFRYARSHGLMMWSKAEAVEMAEQASDTLGQTVISGVSAVSERIGLGRLVAPDAPPSPAAFIPPPEPPKAPAARARRPLARVDLPSTFVAFDLETAPVGSLPEEVAPTEASGDTDSPRSTTSGVPTIYSVGSAGVAPPIGVRPQLARQLPADLDPAHLGRIELVIGEDGSVESAKLLGEPRDVRDALFLSAVKAWDFQPALKDGVPVKYRKTIWIAER